MKNLVAATNSTINFEPSFWIDPYKGNHYFFGVQYREDILDSQRTLLDIPVSGEWNTPRRLGNVATIRQTQGPAVVNHRNITRVTDVYVNVDPRGMWAACAQTSKPRCWTTAMIVAEVTNAAGNVVNFAQQMSQAELGLEAANQSLDADRQWIREDEAIPLELLSAIRARHDAQQALAQAINEYNKAQLQLVRALGIAPYAG